MEQAGIMKKESILTSGSGMKIQSDTTPDMDC